MVDINRQRRLIMFMIVIMLINSGMGCGFASVLVNQSVVGEVTVSPIACLFVVIISVILNIGLLKSIHDKLNKYMM